jgi:predicted permease
MRLWRKLRQWMGRRRFEADLAEEVRIHREMEAEYRRTGGEGRHFGSTALALEESREAWGFGWLDSLAQDLRYAWRGFRKAPAFALTVVGTIGLGLGLNTTLFTVFNTYMLQTIAVHDPYSLYEVWWESKDGTYRATWPQFEELRRQNAVPADMAAHDFLFASVDGRFGLGELVSGNYFPMLGPGASLGRTIEPADASAPGTGSVMVLSQSAWKNWYGSDPNILGRKLWLRGQPFEVIGVAGSGFAGVGDVVLDFWIPITMHARVNGGESIFGPAHPARLRVLARLKPGATPEAVRASVLAWAKGNTADLPAERRALSAQIVSRATAIAISPQLLAAFSPIFVAFGLVLAISCANVSNMMLARALSRQREMGIRVSLGAGRSRLVRQLLTESVVLALPAALAGFAISQATLRFATWLLLATVPPAVGKLIRIPPLEADWRVFAFILLASAAATVLFGLVPALQTTRSNLVEANRGDFSSDHRPSRLRNFLVAAQVTVCVLLMIYSGIMLRSEQRVTSRDVRMRTSGVFDLTMSAQHRTKAADRLRQAPGVEEVAGAWRAPLFNSLPQIAVVPSGSKAEVVAGYNFVSPEYFSVLRIPLLRGRAFSADEAKAGAPLAVISEATARRFWPGKDALGETIAIPAKRQGDPRSGRLPAFASARVIGIARDAISGFIGSGIDPSCLYFPTVAGAPGNESLLVSVTGGKEAGRRAIDSALDQLGVGIADQINPLDEVLATMIYPFRVAFWIAGFLGGLALLLTVSGIYGVLSYLVSQRTKEIGIRMALGASEAAVVRMVVAQSMRLVALGAATGAGLALLVAPVFANLVEALKPYDASAYVWAVLLVMAAALGATYRPARTAVAVDPVSALRSD